jgi:hypothetical protein
MHALMQRVAKSAIVVSLVLGSIALGITPGNSGDGTVMMPGTTGAESNFANGDSGASPNQLPALRSSIPNCSRFRPSSTSLFKVEAIWGLSCSQPRPAAC